MGRPSRIFSPLPMPSPFRSGRPRVYGESGLAGLTIHITIRTHRTMAPGGSMAKRVNEITTIQLTTETRDRMFRLKFRKTYDEFLRELCDLYDAEHADARK